MLGGVGWLALSVSDHFCSKVRACLAKDGVIDDEVFEIVR